MTKQYKVRTFDAARPRFGSIPFSSSVLVTRPSERRRIYLLLHFVMISSMVPCIFFEDAPNQMQTDASDSIYS